MDSYR